MANFGQRANFGQAGKLTLAIIIANCAFFVLANLIPNLGAYLGLNLLFFDGFFWQILSSFFMHAGIAHLAMNMAVLYQFGSILERFFGSVKFTILYFGLGIFTNLICLIYIFCAYKFMGQNINLIGASGVICALLGVILCYERQNLKSVLAMVALISFAPLLLASNVAWYAHLIGFGAGFGFGKIQQKFKIL